MSLKQATILSLGKCEFTIWVNNQPRKTRGTYSCYFAASPNRTRHGTGEKQRQGPGNEVRLACILMADRWGALSEIKSVVGISV
jgi:hypothetical protein